jgi:hypothetical protein
MAAAGGAGPPRSFADGRRAAQWTEGRGRRAHRSVAGDTETGRVARREWVVARLAGGGEHGVEKKVEPARHDGSPGRAILLACGTCRCKWGRRTGRLKR